MAIKAKRVGHGIRRHRKAKEASRPTKLLRLLRRRVGNLDLAPVAHGKQMVIVLGPQDVASRTFEPLGSAEATADRLRTSLSEIEAAMDLIEQSEAAARSARAREPLTATESAALKTGGFDDRPLEPGEADPLLEGAARFAKLLSESLTVHEAAERLGHVNESRVRQRLTTTPPTLYAIKVGREWRLPSFQFESQGTVHGIEEIIAALPSDLDVVSVDSWFSIPNPDLVREDDERPLTPLEWLRTGGSPARAAELARDL
jgi:hypothetical protein